jgi:ferredoxin
MVKIMTPKKRPVVDIGICTLCGGCIEVAPRIFRLNNALGFIEVIEADEYSQEEVDEAIKICPVDCIEWEEE